MILHAIGSENRIEIVEPRNFRGFSVRIEGPFASPDAEQRLLDTIAVSREGDHIWVSEDALRAWPSLSDESWWQEGLTAMMNAVEKFGWIDRNNRSIRAHIERL